VDGDFRKRSPVEAATLILAHLRDAWDHAFGEDAKENCLAQQDVVLTVPASFDEVARELTLEAAKRAGLSPSLLEEPQAALYAFLARHGDQTPSLLRSGETILVCDVGGGTTDFSLVRTSLDEGGGLVFERNAVGDHLLLGGDNMDLALARKLEERLSQRGAVRLDVQRWHALAFNCRSAKETLLSDPTRSSCRVVIPGRASSVKIPGRASTKIEAAAATAETATAIE
jgi:molecular chaperone DnaK (HSP70)